MQTVKQKNQTALQIAFDNLWQTMSERSHEIATQRKATWEAQPEEEKQRLIARQVEWEKRQTEKLRIEQEKEWLNQGIAPRYFNATWENWIADSPEKKNALETIKQAWIKNLFINGDNGTGKTHLAMCLTKDGATYRLLPEVFRSVRENLIGEQETINKLGACQLLILDEAGRQKGTEFEQNLLFEIIDKRWNNMLPTTIIGNIDKKEFAKLYGTAILDRLRPEMITFTWGSKRV